MSHNFQMHNQRTHSDEQGATFTLSTCSSMSPILRKPRLAATAAGPLDRTSNTVNGCTSVNVIPTPAVAMVVLWPSIHAIFPFVLLSLSAQRLPGVVCSVSQCSAKSLKFHYCTAGPRFLTWLTVALGGGRSRCAATTGSLARH